MQKSRKTDSLLDVLTLRRQQMSNLMNSDLDGVYSEENETVNRNESGMSFAGKTLKIAEESQNQFKNADKRYKASKKRASRKKIEIPFNTVNPAIFFSSRDGEVLESKRMDQTRDLFPKEMTRDSFPKTLNKELSIIMPRLVSINSQTINKQTTIDKNTEQRESRVLPKPTQDK
jgi:hypothetical protein